MKLINTLLLALALSTALPAALTTEQKVSDFQELSSLYAKYYGPIDWKIAAERFDARDTRPWLERVRASRNDLEFIDICFQYIAAMNDGHVSFSIPANFSANLGFGADIFEDKVLVDSISRTILPLARYPFEVGDEIVSVDGISASELVTRFSRYAVAANTRSTRRLAANYITVRSQRVYPFAHEIGENAEVVIRRASGESVTYSIPWNKVGTPILEFGPSAAVRAIAPNKPDTKASQGSEETLGLREPAEVAEWKAAHRRMFDGLTEASVDTDRFTVLNFGGRAPIFRLPTNFVQRLGRVGSDFFYSGVYTADNLRIGFIRIPSYSPASGTALQTEVFAREMIFMEANTDGLIIDDMRNPGGSACFVEDLTTLLTRSRSRGLSYEFRPDRSIVNSFESDVRSARLLGFPTWVIDNWAWTLGELRSAYAAGGRTAGIGLCQPDSESLLPFEVEGLGLIGYTKPIMVLVDELSASGGDAFPAILQDNRRALIYGMRTMGLGGTVVNFKGTTYSESGTRVTRSLMRRKDNVIVPGLPVAPYVENLGVQPDIVDDYQTRDNLLNGGRAFVDAFTAAMVRHIRTPR